MKSNKFFSILRVVLFSAVLLGGCVVGFLLDERPTVSENEERRLTEFPDFTWESFLSGDYTAKISLWYSDTYPGRDALLNLSARIKGLYGIRTNDFSGSHVPTDTINPDETFVWNPDPPAPPTDETIPEPDDTFPEGPETIPEGSGTTPEGPGTTPEGPGTTPEGPGTTPEGSGTTPEGSGTTPEETETEPDGGQVIDGYYVDGDTGYELYYYDRELADRYTRLVTQTALNLDGIARVYTMVVPLSCCYGLSPEQLTQLQASDGIQAIGQLYRALNAYSDQLTAAGQLEYPIVTLDIRDMMREHYENGEYIYFRTDHHWTGLGAFYASRFFLEELGRPAPPLDAYTPYTLEGFRGSLYRHTQNQNLYRHPDTVYAYGSPSVKWVQVEHDGVREDKLLVNPHVTSTNRYLCFSSGDFPYYETHNPQLNDGSRLLIVRESYGNAFLPVVADSFEYVYAVDYRFFRGNIAEFCREHGVRDVLFLNNLDATSDGYTIYWMEKLMKKAVPVHMPSIRNAGFQMPETPQTGDDQNPQSIREHAGTRMGKSTRNEGIARYIGLQKAETAGRRKTYPVPG